MTFLLPSSLSSGSSAFTSLLLLAALSCHVHIRPRGPLGPKTSMVLEALFPGLDLGFDQSDPESSSGQLLLSSLRIDRFSDLPQRISQTNRPRSFPPFQVLLLSFGTH